MSSILQLSPQALDARARWAALLAICSATAYGGSVSVSPVRVELSREKPTSVITLENRGGVAEFYQIEGTDWTQSNGEDHYEKSSNLIVVPPVFRIEPGKSQIVRLGLRNSLHRSEVAYRIFIREMPPAVEVGLGVPTGVKTLLSISIPIFFNGTATPAPRPTLRWTTRTNGSGISDFEIENPSSVHVQIGNVRIGEHGDLPVGLYVLPGQRRRWVPPETIPLAPGPLVVRAETDQGVLTGEAVPASQ